MATQAATSPAVGTAEISRPARSLWKDAWFTFTRDKLHYRLEKYGLLKPEP